MWVAISNNPQIENNETIKSFYQEDCKKNDKVFIENLVRSIKLYRVNEELKQGFEEVKLIQQGKAKSMSLEEVLKELK